MVDHDEGSILVTLGEMQLVWMKQRDGSGALAYPDHVDGSGNIRAECALSESYAHVRDGRIYRYGAVIGSVDDLQPVRH